MSCDVRPLADASVEPFAWESIARPWAVPPGTRGTAAPTHDPLREQQLARAAIEQEAFARGYAEGERAASEAASSRVDTLVRQLANALADMHAARADMLRQSERQVVQLVVAIAERVVQREITVDPQLLVMLARSALERLGNRGSATIRLHPDDYHAIEAGAASSDDAHVRIVADPAVERGGCLVDSDLGTIDGSPDAQFRELAHALFEDPGAADTPRIGEP